LELVKAIILGVVQGLSEFLPISSSGHLVLISKILNFNQQGIAFEVFVHFGTLLAVLVVFRKDIWELIKAIPGIPAFLSNGMKVSSSEHEYPALFVYLFLGTIPAAILGVLFEEQVEKYFDNVLFVLLALMVTSIIMWSSRYTREKLSFMNGNHSILIGIAQALAIVPGISRSGSTIVTGLWLGIRRELVAKYSFLLSVPVILGATVLKLKSLIEVPPQSSELINIIGGTIAAALSGYLAIIWLLDIIQKQKLEWFGIYTAAVSILGLTILFLL